METGSAKIFGPRIRREGHNHTTDWIEGCLPAAGCQPGLALRHFRVFVSVARVQIGVGHCFLLSRSLPREGPEKTFRFRMPLPIVGRSSSDFYYFHNPPIQDDQIDSRRKTEPETGR